MRLAVASDAPAIATLMEASIREIFPAHYDVEQVESSVKHIAQLDPLLIDDGTYFVHEEGGEIVACGGWSRRNKLFAGRGDAAGDDRLLDPATEPARVRAMFVRGDWARVGSAGRSWRRARTLRARRGSRTWYSAPHSPASRSTARSASRRSSDSTSRCLTA